MKLNNKRVAIMATHGYEQSELFEPMNAVKNEGASVDIISNTTDDIKGWNDGDWGKSIAVDKTLDEASAADYDSLILPGGVVNPDTLRTDERALNFIRSFFDAGKPVSAICHAPWLLISADVVKDRKVTSYKSIKDDLVNAGANWVDESVVVDSGLTTSRNPNDLEEFCNKVVEETAEGKHQEQMASV